MRSESCAWHYLYPAQAIFSFLWGFCEVSVRFLWGFCVVSVRFLCGFCEVSVRFLCGVSVWFFCLVFLCGFPDMSCLLYVSTAELSLTGRLPACQLLTARYGWILTGRAYYLFTICPLLMTQAQSTSLDIFPKTNVGLTHIIPRPLSHSWDVYLAVFPSSGDQDWLKHRDIQLSSLLAGPVTCLGCCVNSLSDVAMSWPAVGQPVLASSHKEITNMGCWVSWGRSEERRVGKEGRSRWSPQHYK